MATVCDENSNGKIMQSCDSFQINDNQTNVLSVFNNIVSKKSSESSFLVSHYIAEESTESFFFS